MLKPGGRFAVSDVVVRGEVPAEIRRNVELWVGCIAGALEESEYARSSRGRLRGDRHRADAHLQGRGRPRVPLGAGIDVDAIAPLVDGKFFSAFIRARKPAVAARPA